MVDTSKAGSWHPQTCQCCGAGGARLAGRTRPARLASPQPDTPAMSAAAPHYLLLTEATPLACPAEAGHCSTGRWRFVLADPQGVPALQAEDHEPLVGPERLELLAVIRGLESIDSPSRVKILSPSPRLRRAVEQDLARWRASDWQWERYGQMVPIKNSDLWQRLDRLLQIHVVEWGPSTLQAADDLRPPPSVVSSHMDCGEKRLRIDRPLKTRAPSPGGSPEGKHERARSSGRIVSLRQTATGRTLRRTRSLAAGEDGLRWAALVRLCRSLIASVHIAWCWLSGRLLRHGAKHI